MPEGAFTDSELEAAVQAMSDPERFKEAQAVVEQAAPHLQKVLGLALKEGGWFDEVHEHAVTVAASTEDDEERLAVFKTLLAEEARVGMLVGVAVGFELARELNTRREN